MVALFALCWEAVGKVQSTPDLVAGSSRFASSGAEGPLLSSCATGASLPASALCSECLLVCVSLVPTSTGRSFKTDLMTLKPVL